MLTFKLWWEQCRRTGSAVRFVIVLYAEFFDTWSLPHMAKFHRIVCNLSFRSAAFKRLFRDGACLGAGAGMDRFSLITKGALSRSCFAFFARSRQKFRHSPVCNHLNSSLLRCSIFVWFGKLCCSTHICSTL